MNWRPSPRRPLPGGSRRYWVEAERHVPGRIDHTSGRVEFGDLAHPEVDDLLDDLGELVLNKCGQIVIVPAERMPTETGVAAIYRF
jgi:hypothetical protein